MLLELCQEHEDLEHSNLPCQSYTPGAPNTISVLFWKKKFKNLL